MPILAILLYLANRAKEPSTHAGLGGVAIALGQMFPEYSAVLNAAGGLLGAIAALIADQKAKAGG